MESRRSWTWLALVLGILLALISVLADQIGFGMTPGFGWKQTVGLAVGVLIVVLAARRMR